MAILPLVIAGCLLHRKDTNSSLCCIWNFINVTSWSSKDIFNSEIFTTVVFFFQNFHHLWASLCVKNTNDHGKSGKNKKYGFLSSNTEKLWLIPIYVFTCHWISLLRIINNSNKTLKNGLSSLYFSFGQKHFAMNACQNTHSCKTSLTVLQSKYFHNVCIRESPGCW